MASKVERGEGIDIKDRRKRRRGGNALIQISLLVDQQIRGTHRVGCHVSQRWGSNGVANW